MVKEPCYDQEIEEWVDKQIKIHNLCPNDIIRDRLKKIKKCTVHFSRYNIRNNNIFNDKLLEYPKFPTGLVELAVLILCYEQPAPNRELTNVSDQPAAIVRSLRNRGFIFKSDNNRSFLFRKSGVSHRKIVGFDIPTFDYSQPFIKCSKENYKKFLDDKKDPITGRRDNCEIDHRTPRKACKKLSKRPMELTDNLIKQGKADQFFQVFHRKTNEMKRAACNACMEGEEIPVPGIIKPIRYHYKLKWDKDNIKNQSCKGCFWYNYTKPKISFKKVIIK